MKYRAQWAGMSLSALAAVVSANALAESQSNLRVILPESSEVTADPRYEVTLEHNGETKTERVTHGEDVTLSYELPDNTDPDSVELQGGADATLDRDERTVTFQEVTAKTTAKLGSWEHVVASGGDTQEYTPEDSERTHRLHAFEPTGDHQFQIDDPGNDGEVEVLVVGGGGGGGQASMKDEGAGGGGAGGLIEQTVSVDRQEYEIHVGAGGGVPASGQRKPGKNGGDSSALGLTAHGGGGGAAAHTENAEDGGSGGGGGCYSAERGSPIDAEQGHKGGAHGSSNGGNPDAAAGGGGYATAGEQGQNDQYGGDGGDGIDLSDKYTSAYGDNGAFAGGGGGGVGRQGDQSNAPGDGGLGGGGAGGYATNADPGVDGSGGGGGGTSEDDFSAASGGSGVVLIRYPIEAEAE